MGFQHWLDSRKRGPRVGDRLYKSDLMQLAALATQLFLSLTDSSLRFALHLLGGVAFDSTDDIIYLATNLFSLSCRNIFTSHVKLL